MQLERSAERANEIQHKMRLVAWIKGIKTTVCCFGLPIGGILVQELIDSRKSYELQETGCEWASFVPAVGGNCGFVGRTCPEKMIFECVAILQS